MKATKVYSIELLFVIEPQIEKAAAECLCNHLLDDARECLTSLGFDVESGSIRSSVLLYLEAEPGDDVTQLGRSLTQIH
jgi:hypothetical protein